MNNGQEAAFPGIEQGRVLDYGETVYRTADGLTKRELFAAMAMAAISRDDGLGHEECAEWAVQRADALLKELAT